MKESESFVAVAVREFKRLKQLADDAVSQISEEQFFHREQETDNSVAVIYKHIAGNMVSRWTDFLTTDGEKPDRDRDAEFVILDSECAKIRFARELETGDRQGGSISLRCGFQSF